MPELAWQTVAYMRQGGWVMVPLAAVSLVLWTLIVERFRTYRSLDGGLRDHLAGGFHRYSVDRFWRVPHFEEMLYDNVLLAQVYLRAWQLTQRNEYASVAGSTLDFVLNEMSAEGGGFYAT